jgi:hypothetical protein
MTNTELAARIEETRRKTYFSFFMIPALISAAFEMWSFVFVFASACVADAIIGGFAGLAVALAAAKAGEGER